MLKKLIDNNIPNNTSYQYLNTFGYDCLRKIKNLQKKFNYMDWDIEKYPFQLVVIKIRNMLDSYQIIAHQIYNSCQTAQLASLGHSIIKMFLQVYSGIKWLIKSFISFMCVAEGIKDKRNQKKISNNQTSNFRKKQIEKFLLKGVIKKIDIQQQQQNNQRQEGVHSLLNQSKQSYQNTKNTILSIGSSNLPIILEQAAQYFTKKSEYLDKFVALRQNYQGFYRIQNVPTSQAIIQSQHLLKNGEAFEKFKQIHNKFMLLQTKKAQINKVQYGIQVSIPVQTNNQKFKKSIQYNKNNKLIIEQLQKQKYQNKHLRSEIQAYQRKLNSSIKQYQEIMGRKKQKTISSKFNQKNFESLHSSSNWHQKQLNQNDNQVASEIQQQQITQKDQKSKFLLGFKRNSHVAYRRSNYLLQRGGSLRQNPSHKNQITIQKSLNYGQITNLNFFNQVYDLKIQNILSKKKLSYVVYDINFLENKKHCSKQLNFQPSDLKQFQQLSRRFISNKVGAFSPNFTSITSTSILLANEAFVNIKSNRKKQTPAKNKPNKTHIHRQNKIQKGKNINFEIQDQILANPSQVKFIKTKQTLDFKMEFQKYYIMKKINNFQINIQKINNFFIDQKNANNYQLLNISQIFSRHKKSRFCRRQQKNNRNLGLLSIQSSVNQKQNSFSQIDLDNMAYNILSKTFYKQILNLKRHNKNIYLTLILFLRYPFSSFYRNQQIHKKMLIQQQNNIQFAEIKSHFRRIWNMHNSCHDFKDNIMSVKWCIHKENILNFFGIQKNVKKNQTSITSIENP